VEELRTGIIGETRRKWLVSCKHKAHSGASVNPTDEPDIHDRVKTHECDGFLAVYSSVPSSGLAAKLNATKLPFEVQVYDHERIEKHLLQTPLGVRLAKRFFPKSIGRWEGNQSSPARIFTQPPELLCKYCGKSLLWPKPHGIYVEWTKLDDDGGANVGRIEHLYWCCKGACDQGLKLRHRRKGIVDGWEDIPDMIIPTVFIRWVIVMLNEMDGGVAYSQEAFANAKKLLMNLFPLVARHLTDDEKEEVKGLMQIPQSLGGLGYD
jgi:hypothetical protein